MDPVMLVSLAGTVCTVAVVLLVGVVGLMVRRRGRAVPAFTEREITDAVTEAAAALGLEEHGTRTWEGWLQNRRVRWHLREVDHDGEGRLQLAIGTPVQTGQLALTHRTLVYGVELPELELPECKTGDAEFDVRFHVHADLEHLSILSPSVRRVLLDAAMDAELRIRDGWMWIDQIATPGIALRAPLRVEGAFAAATAFEAAPAEVEHRVRWLSQDPVARVRVNTLDLLAARGASDFTSWIARPLQTDADPQVRVRAAEVLGDSEKLLEIVCDEKAPVDIRARAARALDTMGAPTERLAAAEALARGRGRLQDASMQLCQSIGEASETVVMDLVQSTDGMVARRAVGLLGRVGTARSLGVLQGVVDESPQTLLRIEAHAALEAMRSRSAASRRALRSTPPAEQRSVTPRSRSRVTGERTRRLPGADR